MKILNIALCVFFLTERRLWVERRRVTLGGWICDGLLCGLPEVIHTLTGSSKEG